jgi:hypothetical protein
VERLGDDGELKEHFEGDDFESGFVGRLENHGAGGTGALHLQPTRGADAPPIAGFEAWEPVLGHGSDEIVAEFPRGFEELLRDDAADGVDAEIGRAGVAVAVAIEASHRVAATLIERLAEHILLRGDRLWDGAHL